MTEGNEDHRVWSSSKLRGQSEEEKQAFAERQRQLLMKEQQRERNQRAQQLALLRSQLETERQSRNSTRPTSSEPDNKTPSSDPTGSSTSSSSSPSSSSTPSNIIITTTTAAAAAAAATNHDECTLQIRLPGSGDLVLKRKFLATDTIRDVREFVSVSLHTPYDFDLVLPAFPRRILSDDSLTLRDSGLCPRAQLLVQRVSDRGQLSRGQGVVGDRLVHDRSWFFGQNRPPPPQLPPATDASLTDSGLTFEQLARLRVFHFDSRQMFDDVRQIREQAGPDLGDTLDLSTYNRCALCKRDYENQQEIVCLPNCNHRFHKTCVYRYFRNHVSCPRCKTIITQFLINDNENRDAAIATTAR